MSLNNDIESDDCSFMDRGMIFHNGTATQQGTLDNTSIFDNHIILNYATFNVHRFPDFASFSNY